MRLRENHFKTVADAARDFDKYLKDLVGDDAEIAFEAGYRKDRNPYSKAKKSGKSAKHGHGLRIKKQEPEDEDSNTETESSDEDQSTSESDSE